MKREQTMDFNMIATTVELDRLKLGLIRDLIKQHADKMKQRRGETQRDFDFWRGGYYL